MATSTAVPTKLKKAQVTAASQIDFTSAATFHCLLVTAGSGAPNTTDIGVEFVADVTATNPEVAGTGYARQTLTGVTLAYDGSVNTQVDWTFDNITFAQNAAGFTNARYAIIYTTQLGTGDATYPVVGVCDLGANQSVQTAELVLQCPVGGLIFWS